MIPLPLTRWEVTEVTKRQETVPLILKHRYILNEARVPS